MTNFWRLVWFELKKLVSRRIVRISVFCLLLVTVCTVAGSNLAACFDEDAKAEFQDMAKDREYRQALDGRLIDQELLEEVAEAYAKVPEVEKYSLTKEYQTYARPYSAAFQMVRGMLGISTSAMRAWEPKEQEFYLLWDKVLVKQWTADNLTEGEQEYFKNLRAEITEPIQFHSIDESYYMLQKGINTFGVLGIFVMLVCLTGVFPEEHVRKTDQLLLGCKNGKQVLYRAKIVAGILFAAAVSVVCTGVSFCLAFAIYGTEGFDAPFYLSKATYVYPITMGEAIILCYIIFIVACVFTAVVVMMLSEVLHSSLAVLAITFFIAFIGQFFSVPTQYRVVSQLWDYLPSRFVMTYQVFENQTVPLFGQYFMAWQAVPVLYLLLGAFFVWIGKQVYLRYQVSGR